MDHIGIDVHKLESQICMLGAGDELIERRVRTTPERFADVLGDRRRARILLEASTESEWVARCLEGLGHEVIVADPNFAPMYATRTRKVKTDRRDARARRPPGGPEPPRPEPARMSLAGGFLSMGEELLREARWGGFPGTYHFFRTFVIARLDDAN